MRTQITVLMGVNVQWASYPRRQALDALAWGISVLMDASEKRMVSARRMPYPFLRVFISSSYSYSETMLT